MKIVISSGHGKLVRGASGVIDEVDEARKVVNKVAEYLKDAGVGVAVFHDDLSTSQSENLDRIVRFHNGKIRDLDVSVHFNCYDGTAHGCEVLYVSQHDLAAKISDKICEVSGLTNRGPKKRTDLAFLNNTDEPAVLLEICFVDNADDADTYNSRFNAICGAIVEAITGIELEPPQSIPVVTIKIDPPGSVKIIT